MRSGLLSFVTAVLGPISLTFLLDGICTAAMLFPIKTFKGSAPHVSSALAASLGALVCGGGDG
jgi:hypothetical protein